MNRVIQAHSSVSHFFLLNVFEFIHVVCVVMAHAFSRGTVGLLNISTADILEGPFFVVGGLSYALEAV